MKVYVLGNDDYEGMNIIGIYSTKEKAIEALPYENMNENDIYEYEIDTPNDGEKYELFYYCGMDGSEVWTGEMKEKPSQVKYCKYALGHPSRVSGTGRTPEEARINAEKAKSELHLIWQISDNGTEVHHSHPSMIYDWTHCGTGCYAVHEDYNVAKIAVMEYMATGKLSPFLTVIDKPV